ncbi:toluene efflux pump outer membrane protein TtgC precursor [bacterium BMS3Abin05]|nr:toluene efflux pump outer membrane protein TtgC precursor [bacterium BMS3Abin05]GBE27731.1 toluene efflux pump outer membrane protein TtgC precursor [bacterium BMS3Bbin03]HDK35810.1 TolC family protein [Bacteroidota bacterium]HDL78815.1 TolC family protein [Bacteroidota bacterium]
MKKIGAFGFVIAMALMIPTAYGNQRQNLKDSQSPASTGSDAITNVQKLSLAQCIDIALKNNRKHAISELQIKIAQAQHKQALSSFWPQVTAQSSLIRIDKDPVFLYPKETTTYEVSGFPSPSFPPMEFTVTIPANYVKQMDKTNLSSSLGIVYPIFTGGMRRALTRQTKGGIEIARQNLRKTDLELILDVKKLYYGAVLAGKIHKIASDALERLEVLLELTENMYKKGSGRVKKTDYLKNKMMVESVRAMVANMKGNEQIVKAALANTLGFDWDTPIELAAKEIPYKPYGFDLKKLVTDSYQFNPDWAKLAAALNVYKAKIKEAKSGYFPKFALTGNLVHVENKYHAGIVSPRNRTLWVVGIGMEFPLFNGFRTRNQVREAKARLEKLEQGKILLRKGIALQVKYYCLQLAQLQEQETALKSAMSASIENRKLNERAYQADMVKTEDVIHSQIFESISKARYEKILYDAVVAQANLDYIVGTQVNKLFGKEK